jgi:Sap-like sulfolipid-1-addressing protein
LQVFEIFLLALASMVWPTLIAVVVVALTSAQPVRLLSWFLAGSLLTTVTIGTVIVLLLEKSDLLSSSRPAFSSATYLVASVAALLVAYIVWRRSRSAADTPTESTQPGWSERTLSRGGLLAFVAGIVLNVIPGVLPFVALKDIAELDYAAGASVALVVGFYLIMFLPAEVPLGSYLFAPRRTEIVVGRFNVWLKRNAPLIAVYVLAAAGIYLGVRGVVSL